MDLDERTETGPRPSPSGRPRPEGHGGEPAGGGTFAGHIVWDWNGTLLHDIEAVVAATNSAFATLGASALTLERYRELYCLPVPRFYERILGRAPTEREWETANHAFHTHYTTLAEGLELAVGAARLLADRQTAGWTQSLCSLAPHEELIPLVRRYGIDRHFTRVDGGTHGPATGKAEQMARHLAALGGVDPARIVVIGDAVDDAVAAAHIGARAVLYTGGSHSRRSLERAGTPVVDTLEEAVAVAERTLALPGPGSDPSSTAADSPDPTDSPASFGSPDSTGSQGLTRVDSGS